MKKTIFLFISALLLLPLYARQPSEINWEKTLGQTEIDSIEVYLISKRIQEYLDKISKNVIRQIAINGGYYFLRDSSIKAYGNISDGEEFIPAIEDVEKEISIAISEKLIDYTYTSNYDSDYKLILEKSIIEAAISDTNIKIKVSGPMAAIIKNSMYKIKNFEIEVTTPFGKIYNAAREFFKKELSASEDDMICLSCLLEIWNEYNVYAYIAEAGGNDNDIEWLLMELEKKDILIFFFGRLLPDIDNSGNDVSDEINVDEEKW